MSSKERAKVILDEKDIPRQWYNILADMPNKPEPYQNPATGKSLQPDDLAAVFPKEILKQEMSTDRWIDIPEQVSEMYLQWRSTPLYRARNLEKILDTPAKIYYKFEGTNATGSHKLNTALPQAYYNKQAGIKRLTTETGGAQWGSALSLACNFFGLDCTVYMVKASFELKASRRSFMNTFGATVIASPSQLTRAGKLILEKDPDCSGSLGIAISEAMEDALNHPDTNYSLGSVLNHVCMHQTIIGLEAKKQMEIMGQYPDVVIACCGGGSNFSGMAFPFLKDKLTEGKKLRAVAVEPKACPTLTEGSFEYDYSDTGKVGPMVKMYTLGHAFVPGAKHVGGLRYHGASPIISQLYADGIIEAAAYTQNEIFDAAVFFAKAEGIVPAPESAHAIKGAIHEALLAKEAGKGEVILFNLSGHGYFDFSSYDYHFKGQMED
ncbi:MAG: TrpB-like pyridoxal phosphate-dependent enzyme [Veillonellales bacterium]